MSDSDKPAMHYVCTRDEAVKLIDGAPGFWVGICGCRSGRGRCEKSRMDVCLEFKEQTAAEGAGRRKLDRAGAMELIREAEEKHLVTRPFRDETRQEVDGICFCCDCCCGYFGGGDDYPCDKGAYIERTDTDVCTDCGACIEVCYFGARDMVGDSFRVDRDKCFGCGLCLDVCPADCIEMVPRGG